MPGLVAAATLPLALTALLFAGPLLSLALAWRERAPPPPTLTPSPSSGGLTGAARWRNWVVAPLTEELTFRACLLSFLLASGVARPAALWLSPLIFASAHLHHLHELIAHQGASPGAALRCLAPQLAYTTLFGWLAAFFFLRTRHLAAAVLPHAFCNAVGPPGAPPRSIPLHVTAAAYLVGIAAFYGNLYPWTEPHLFGNAAPL